MVEKMISNRPKTKRLINGILDCVFPAICQN